MEDENEGKILEYANAKKKPFLEKVVKSLCSLLVYIYSFFNCPARSFYKQLTE